MTNIITARKKTIGMEYRAKPLVALYEKYTDKTRLTIAIVKTYKKSVDPKTANADDYAIQAAALTGKAGSVTERLKELLGVEFEVVRNFLAEVKEMKVSYGMLAYMIEADISETFVSFIKSDPSPDHNFFIQSRIICFGQTNAEKCLDAISEYNDKVVEMFRKDKAANVRLVNPLYIMEIKDLKIKTDANVALLFKAAANIKSLVETLVTIKEFDKAATASTSYSRAVDLGAKSFILGGNAFIKEANKIFKELSGTKYVEAGDADDLKINKFYREMKNVAWGKATEKTKGAPKEELKSGAKKTTL